jgi:hypothetical protein
MTDLVDTLEAETAFATALAIVQSAMPRVGKDRSASIRSDKGSYTYKYSDLASILDAVSPVAAAQGFSFMATPTLSAGGAFVLRYCLLHKGGHREGGEYPLPDPSRSTPQQVGSHITYARRYVYCAMLGVAADEDDDGRAGAVTPSRGTARAQVPLAVPVDEDNDARPDTQPLPRPRQAPRPVVDGSAASLQVPPMGPDIVDKTTGELTAAAVARSSTLKPVNAAQLKMMMSLFNKSGVTDRTERLTIVAGIVDRDVESTKDLDVAEASKVINSLLDEQKVRVTA